MRYGLKSLFGWQLTLAAVALLYNGYKQLPRSPLDIHCRNIYCEKITVKQPQGEATVVIWAQNYNAHIWLTNQRGSSNERGVVGLNAMNGGGQIWVWDGKTIGYNWALVVDRWHQTSMQGADGTSKTIVHVTPEILQGLRGLLPPEHIVPVAPRDDDL